MHRRPKRAILIGLDAAIIELIEKFAKEGKIPVLKQIMENGVLGRLLCPYPTITPPNWATIATGAWPATHGIPSFEIYRHNWPLDQTWTCFDPKLCQAETLWEAVDRVGKRSILMKYWGTWPPKLKSTIQVEGTSVSFFRGENTPILELSLGYFFSTASIAGRDQQVVKKIKISQADKWDSLPTSLVYPLETVLTFELLDGGIKDYYVLLENRGNGYDKITVCPSRDYSSRIVSFKVGTWCSWFKGDFSTRRGERKGAVVMKLQKLTPDGRKMEIYVPPIYPLEGFTQPAGLASELIEKFGPFSPKIQGRLEGAWVSDETYYEWYHRHNLWMGEASAYLMKKHDWTLFCTQNHCFDHIHHAYLTKYDPLTTDVRKHHAWFKMPSRKIAEKMIPMFYESVDKMLGKILQGVDNETLVVVVSDHGANASRDEISIKKVLEETGFVVHKDRSLKSESSGDDWVVRDRTIDWSRTKAFPSIRGHIFLNVKGRQPNGIIEPGNEYEEVRDQLIETLYDYEDSQTHKRAFSLVLKREDAPLLGQSSGELSGDVIVALRPEFVGHEHGLSLPTAKYGVGSAGCLFIMMGPGVKRGEKLKSLRWLTDVAPTIAHLIRIPVPRNCEGGIMYDALEDPDSFVI